ncbi:MAG: two-CW domain-containing protein [Thermodesulfobacteriota bacterium]
MDKTDFSRIRTRLGKSQKQIAQLLGLSVKAVQSFEQGWRKIPLYVERQMLFLLAMKKGLKRKPCWDLQACPAETREKCPAWEFNSGRLCWFVNGTICQGEVLTTWQKKMELCRRCQVFRLLLQPEE